MDEDDWYTAYDTLTARQEEEKEPAYDFVTPEKLLVYAPVIKLNPAGFLLESSTESKGTLALVCPQLIGASRFVEEEDRRFIFTGTRWELLWVQK